MVSLATYNSSFQTFLVKQYLKSLAKHLNTEITVGEVNVSFFNTAKLKNLFIRDLHKDTLLYVDELDVDIDEFSVKDKKIILDDVVLSDCYFNLQNYKNKKGSNLTFIIDYFSSKDTTSKSDWKFG